MAETVRIPTLEGDKSFPAYVVRPAGTPRAAIIVVQEVFGVNPGIRKKADDRMLFRGKTAPTAAYIEQVH